MKTQGDGNVGNRVIICNLFSHLLTLGKPMNIPFIRTLKRKKISLHEGFFRARSLKARDDDGHASVRLGTPVIVRIIGRRW